MKRDPRRTLTATPRLTHTGAAAASALAVFLPALAHGQASFPAQFQLSTLNGANGFRINGEAADDYSGVSVSAAGDVNGDGLGDLIIGAYGADPNGSYSGASYVVFGATAFTTPLNLTTLNGANGFKINGEAAGHSLGWSVSAAGDVNGDGLGDLILGAYGADANGTDSGASYVVFGSTSGFANPLDLSTLNGANGFKIYGERRMVSLDGASAPQAM